VRVFALVLAGALLLAMSPAFAGSAAPKPAQGVWLQVGPDGAHVVQGAAPRSASDTTQGCEGDAPFENSCHIECDCGTGAWLVGWNAPGGFLGTPVGTVEMSTLMTLRSDRGGLVQFECDWGVNPAGTILPGMVRCALQAYQGDLSGHFSIDMHVGVIDPAAVNGALPSLNSVEAGVGHWAFFIDC